MINKRKFKIFEKVDRKNVIGYWIDYYLFGFKVKTKLVCLYRYN